MLEDESQTRSKCNICGRRFSGKDELKSHVRSAHFGMDDEAQAHKPHNLPEVISLDDDNKMYKSDDSITLDLESVCHVCFSIFKNQEDLNLHSKMAHGTSDNDINESEKVKIPNSEKKTKALEPVPVLSNTPVSISKKALAIEIQQTNTVTNVTTEECVNSGEIKECFDTKEITPRCNTVMCNICLEEFVTKESLAIHIKAVHFGISRFQCAMCTKSFDTKECVIKHYTKCDGAASLSDAKDILKRKEPPDQDKPRNSNRKTVSEIKGDSVCVSKRQRTDIEAKSYHESAIIKKESDQENILNEENDRKKSNTAGKRKKEQMAMTPNLCLVSPPKKNKLNKNILIPDISRDISGVSCVLETYYKNLRPCYICGMKFFSSHNELNHMTLYHCTYRTPVFREGLKMNVKKFKCLRCGKVGELLESMQCHLQLKCLRSPFNGVNVLPDLYCTICGEHFSDYKLHDKHVAKTHYWHLFEKAALCKPSIPFRHILLYHVSPSVCQHCGKSCQCVTENGMSRSSSEIKCIDGPFVCPFAHKSKLSRCTFDLLLHHLKFCPYKGGVLALQCNNCFKMLLCNNSSEQISQLKRVINKDDLKCCSKNDKRFKCYCCANDYQWSMITYELVKSIQCLDDARRFSFNNEDYLNRVLSCNPSIHNQNLHRPEREPFSVTSTTTTDSSEMRTTKSMTLGRKNVENPNIVVRQTSFDAISKNLAKLQHGFQKSIKITNTFSQALATKKVVNSSPLIGKTIDQLRDGNVKRPEVSKSQNNAIKSMDIVTDKTLVASISSTKTVEEHYEGPRKKDICTSNELPSINEDSSPSQGCQVVCKSNVNAGKSNVNVGENTENLNKFKSKNVIGKPTVQLISSCGPSRITGSGKSPKSTEQAKSVPLKSAYTQKFTATIDHVSRPLSLPVAAEEHEIGNIYNFQYYTDVPMHMTANGRFKCFDCNLVFTNQMTWRTHVLKLHPDCTILTCDFLGCGSEFQRPLDLQAHIFFEHSSTYGCAVCLKMFQSEDELVNHTRYLHQAA